MPIELKRVAAQEVPKTAASIYTVPTGKSFRLQELMFSNNAGAARTVQVWIVAGAAARDNSNEISGGGIDVDQGIPFAIGLQTAMEDGESIWMQANGEDVAVRVSGVELS